jgi:DNA polymerase-3 subunit chi
MTRIDFYSNAESRLQTACLLIGKAFQKRMKVLVFAPDREIAHSINRLLWTFRATGFVPHCLSGDRLAPRTPVVIAGNPDVAGHDQLILNLSHECPTAFSRYQRLIEVVGREAEERRVARERWRFYKERGYEVNHVELAAS